MHVGIVGLGRMGRSLGRLAHQRGHVVAGWDPSDASREAARELGELMGNALATETAWERLSTHVEDTGEVKRMLSWATDRDIPLPVVSAAQMSLMLSRDEGWPAARAVALLRNQFGGRPVHRRDG